MAKECELHRRLVISGGVRVDRAVLVEPCQGERLGAGRPFSRKPAVSGADLETDPLERLVDGEFDRERGNSNREASACSMDLRDRCGAGAPTVQQHPVDPQRVVFDGALAIIRWGGSGDSAEYEPHNLTGRDRPGGRLRLLGWLMYPPSCRASSDDTEHECNRDHAAMSPCRREPARQRRSSGTTLQDLLLGCRGLLRRSHPRTIRHVRLTGSDPALSRSGVDGASP